jgi:serpin B
MAWSVLVLAAVTACHPTASEPAPVARVDARTALPRALTPAEQSVLDASNAFSFALWNRLTTAQLDTNIFVSPLSVSFVLGMAMNGANGTTFSEMASALQLGKTPVDSIDRGYRSLIALLTSLDPSTTMEIANSLWYRNGFPFNQSFLNDASTYFGAQVGGLNFDDVPAVLARVNGWASDNTHGRIPKVLDSVDPAAVMYLMNAIYFKGAWRERFDSAATHVDVFHGVGGDQRVPLMHRDGLMSYAVTASYQAVDLAYGDSTFTMTILLPSAGNTVESVAASLTPTSWQTLVQSLHRAEVALDLPRVTLSWKRDLVGDMKSLGMHAAFDAADFSRMSPRGRELVISRLQQNAFVKIDEQGTEAAAVTTGIAVVTSLPVRTPMRVDHPFIVVIRERLSGTILFIGKVVQIPTT